MTYIVETASWRNEIERVSIEVAYEEDLADDIRTSWRMWGVDTYSCVVLDRVRSRACVGLQFTLDTVIQILWKSQLTQVPDVNLVLRERGPTSMALVEPLICCL
jgi:hypothetical protein